MFEKDDETGELKAMHHPFTHPRNEDIPLLETEPEKVKAIAYDIVLNGVELGGGSIRIHERDLQAKMFKALKLTEEECQEKFGFLLEAFKYGAAASRRSGLRIGQTCNAALRTAQHQGSYGIP